MKKSATLLAILLALQVSAASAESGKTTSTETDQNGTTTTVEKSHSDTTGLTGTRTEKNDEEKSVDPKGLGNKTTTESHEKIENKPNGDFYKKESNTDENGTTHEDTVEKSTSGHWTDKGKTTTTTHTKVTDPKGLLNKKKSVTKEKVETDENGNVVSKTKSGS